MVILQDDTQLLDKWLTGQHMRVSAEFVRNIKRSKMKVDMPHAL